MTSSPYTSPPSRHCACWTRPWLSWRWPVSPFAGTCGEHGAAEGTLRARSPTCAAEPPAGLGGAKGRGPLSARCPPGPGSPSWAPSFCHCWLWACSSGSPHLYAGPGPGQHRQTHRLNFALLQAGPGLTGRISLVLAFSTRGTEPLDSWPGSAASQEPLGGSRDEPAAPWPCVAWPGSVLSSQPRMQETVAF